MSGGPRCGVLGVGALGGAIAERLAAQGLPVAAHDRDPERVAGLAGTIAACASPRELAAAADVVLVLLPDTPDVLAVLDGPDGLAAGLAPGAVVVLNSTVAVDTPAEVAARLAATGARVVDAPVSGGPVAARAGDLRIMVGGDDDAVAACRPALEAIGQPHHVGPLGHGEITKLVNNLMGSVISVGIAEGLALAARAGADVDRVREAIDGGSGSSWILSEWMPRTVLAGRSDADFAVRLMCKDLRVIAEYADQLGVPLEAARLARETYEQVRDEGYGDRDFSVLVALRAAQAGVPMAVDPPLDQGR